MDEAYLASLRTYHIIWVKRNKSNNAWYSEMECFNPDFYSNMMEQEFDLKNYKQR